MKLYLYFNDLSCSAGRSNQSPRSAPKRSRKHPIATSRRARGNNRTHRHVPATLRYPSLGTVQKRPLDAPAVSTARRGGVRQHGHLREQFAPQPRGEALRLLPAFRRESAFLAATAALDVGVTPDYQIHVDSLR